MNKITPIIITSLITVFTILGIISTQDLEQINKETIFLTNSSKNEYLNFQKRFSEKKIIIAKKDFPTISIETKNVFKLELQKLKDKCLEICQIIGPNDLPKNMQNLFKLQSPNYLAFILISENNEKFIKDYLSHFSKNSYWGKIGNDLHLIGGPFTKSLLDKYSKSIKETLFPALFIGVFLFLLFLTKSLKSAIALFIPCLSASSLSLFMTKIIFKDSNLIIAVVPLILFVIMLSLVMHVYYTAIEENCLISAIKKKMKPILLMVTTTYVGFLSLALSELAIIREFGILSSSLILISAVITLLWLSQIDKILNFIPKETNESKKFDRVFKDLFHSFFSHRTILIISISSIIVGIFVFSKIPIITNPTEYFPKDSGLKESIDSVAKTVAGPPIIEILIDQKKKLTIKDLRKIELIENKIEKKIKQSSTPLKLLSLNYLVKKANQTYTGVDSIPAMKISYLTVASKIPTNLKEGYPVFKNQYRITILGGAINVHTYEKILSEIDSVLKTEDIIYSYNGLYYHLMTAQKTMINTLFKSFLFSLIVISLLAFITFRKIKVFFIFLIVNIIPVLISFVAMKILNLSFNIATVMTYSISLGLIVDSSFHIIHALDNNYTAEYFYKTVTTPVIQASLILSLAFATFALNGFLPIRQFGICLSIIIFIGMIFDLKILPRLYTNLDKLSDN